MKKLIAVITAAMLVLTSLALAEDTSALDAFSSLTGQQLNAGNPNKTNAEYLTDIMAGAYSAAPTADTAAALASDFQYMPGITNRDIAAFASTNGYEVAQVRNAYYKALANVLRAEIMVNPASEEQYRNMQVVLSLFLEDDATADANSRATIRSGFTPEAASSIAAGYSLPTAFVEFIVMDEDWDDDLWDNDDDWRAEMAWNGDIYDDSTDDYAYGDRDGGGSTRIAALQEMLISLGYLTGNADGVFGPQTQAALMQYQLANGLPATGIIDADDMDDMASVDVVARWDYDDSFYATPDYADTMDYYNSVDYSNTPDYNTPDYNTPDYNTPDYNTPDYSGSYDNSYDDSSDYEDS